MPDPRITKDDFRKCLDEFFNWTLSGERLPSSFYLSLQEWAEWQFNRAYDAEKIARKEAV
jgi:hypothetical protein